MRLRPIILGTWSGIALAVAGGCAATPAPPQEPPRSPGAALVALPDPWLAADGVDSLAGRNDRDQGIGHAPSSAEPTVVRVRTWDRERVRDGRIRNLRWTETRTESRFLRRDR